MEGAAAAAALQGAAVSSSAAAAASSSAAPAAGGSAAAAASSSVAAAASSAAASAAADASDTPFDEHSGRLFIEVDAGIAAGAAAAYEEPPLVVNALPTEWLMDEPLDELICCICTGIVWHAPNLPCGHAMCRSCVDGLPSALCPQCNQAFKRNRLTPNAFVQRMVNQLRVKCRQTDEGCDWTGELGIDGRSLKAHDAVCVLKPVQCKACKQSVLRGDFKAHQQGQCSERIVRCASCQGTMPRSAIDAHFKLQQAAAIGDSEGAKQDDNSAWQQVAAGEGNSPDVQMEDAGASAEAAASSAAAAAAGSARSPSALLPPFVPPCSNSEVCPLGCEDPAHPGHVLSTRISERADHQSVCQQRPVTCLVCHPSHSVPHCRFVAHVESLMTAPVTRSTTAAQVAELCKTAEQVQQELQTARAEAAAMKQQLHVQTADWQKQQQQQQQQLQAAKEVQQQLQTETIQLQQVMQQQQQFASGKTSSKKCRSRSCNISTQNSKPSCSNRSHSSASKKRAPNNWSKITSDCSSGCSSIPS